MQLPEKITQQDKDQFQDSWRVRYIEALKEKQRALSLIATDRNYDSYKNELSIANVKVELLELEKKIFYETVVLKQYRDRSNQEKTIVQSEAEEARNGIDGIIEQANGRIKDIDEWLKKHVPDPNNVMVSDLNEDCRKLIADKKKLESLMSRYGAVNKHDNEQLITFYKSVKIELQKQNVIG